MNKNKVRIAVRSFLEKMKAMDEAIPAELADDALEMAEGVADALGEVEVEDEGEGHEEPEVHDEGMSEAKMAKMMEDTINRVLRKNGLIKDACMKELDELEAELGVEEKEENPTIDVDSEEEVTVDPQTISDSSAAVRKMIREMKPAIAAVKDSKERKRLVDSLVKAVRMNMQTTPDYAAIFAATTANAKKNMDKAPATALNDDDFGRQVAEAWNPHYKKEG